MLHLRGLLTDEELNRARPLLAAARWQDGRGSAGSQAAAVKNNEQLQPDTDEARALQVLVLAALDRSAPFFQAALPKRVLPPLFNRYGGSTNAYGAHVDQAVRYHPATGQGIRTDLSCTLFLSDPADYDGGELILEDLPGRPAHKLPAGDALLYAGSHVHRVAPVTRGVRLASFFWVESLVRSSEQRRLLLDLDDALMRLRDRHGESEETAALTGTYHNLLRLWADT